MSSLSPKEIGCFCKTSKGVSSHLSLNSPVDYCDTKRASQNCDIGSKCYRRSALQKCYSNTKKEGVKVLHLFYPYALSGLSVLSYNIKCV